VVAVGDELVVPLRAIDPDGDDLYYNFRGGPDGVATRAELLRRPDGDAEFHFRPIAADLGTHAIDLLVSDLQFTTQTSIAVEVTAANSKDSKPRFIAPLGNGTALDLARDRCAAVEIVVQDFDSTEVDIREIDPIAGAELVATGPMTAQWSWCPSPGQVAADDRYSLALSADDGANPPTVKDYLIVLRTPPGPVCDGEPPVIVHSPADVTTSGSVRISARITDSGGLSDSPLLYYALGAPAEPIDLGAMIQLTMARESGSDADGTWIADIANPVPGGSSATSASLHYVIVASDEDADGCRRSVSSPAIGSHAMTVTHPGILTCEDDAAEPDDGAATARNATVSPGPFVSNGNQICAGDDDWYRIELFTGERIIVDLLFEHIADGEDLDLHLLNAALTDLTPCSETSPATCSAAQGQGTDSNEHLEARVTGTDCAPCTFFLVVHGWAGSENDYSLRIAFD
jgi:hypothetical protein